VTARELEPVIGREKITRAAGSVNPLFHCEPSCLADNKSIMSLLIPKRQFSATAPVWAEHSMADRKAMEGTLARREKANRHLGSYRAALRAISQVPREKPPDLEVEVLDFCTGSGDVMRELIKLMRTKGEKVRVVGIDSSQAAVERARTLSEEVREFKVEQADVLGAEFPYPPMSFDLCTCTHALHRFTRADAVKLLRRMWRTCRTGMVVSDLRRNRLAVLSAQLFSPLGGNMVYARDAIASVRAAFSPRELEEMAKEARIDWFVIKRRWPFRMTLVALKPTARALFAGSGR
jgi:ubiquinone/menaquinone biosynthesis C-methylase UbiE